MRPRLGAGAGSRRGEMRFTSMGVRVRRDISRYLVKTINQISSRLLPPQPPLNIIFYIFLITFLNINLQLNYDIVFYALYYPISIRNIKFLEGSLRGFQGLSR